MDIKYVLVITDPGTWYVQSLTAKFGNHRVKIKGTNRDVTLMLQERLFRLNEQFCHRVQTTLIIHQVSYAT